MVCLEDFVLLEVNHIAFLWILIFFLVMVSWKYDFRSVLLVISFLAFESPSLIHCHSHLDIIWILTFLPVFHLSASCSGFFDWIFLELHFMLFAVTLVLNVIAILSLFYPRFPIFRTEMCHTCFILVNVWLLRSIVQSWFCLLLRRQMMLDDGHPLCFSALIMWRRHKITEGSNLIVLNSLRQLLVFIM